MPQKKCTRCKKIKLLVEFQKRALAKDGCASMCKPCKRAYDNAHYQAHPDRKKYIAQNRKAARQKAVAFIRQYLLSHPCVDCGETDITVLEFDHVRGKKRAAIATLKQSSQAAVEKEIKKCVVRCANCHRKKTAKQFSWKTKLPP